MPKVSVIAPAYNGQNYIMPFLKSVAGQTLPDFEFIIVDDGSVDQTADILETALAKIGRPSYLIRHKTNKGQGIAAAAAFAQAKGEIVIKVDTDTLLPANTFAEIVKVFERDKAVGLVSPSIKGSSHATWVERGAEIVFVTQYRAFLKNAQDYERIFGMCFGMRRHIFSVEEWPQMTDVDKAWTAQKQGWRIVLLEDVIVKTRFPASVVGVFRRGRRGAVQVLSNYLHHKEKMLTRWAFWVKFAPLGFMITVLVKPRLAIAGIFSWFTVNQIYFYRKAPDFPFSDRIAAWFVLFVHLVGFNVEVIKIVAQTITNRARKSQK